MKTASLNSAVRSAYINARVEPKLKSSATRILKTLGLSTSDAITLFLKQVVLQKGVPFEMHVLNAETIAAIKAAQDPNQVKKSFATTEEAFEDMLGKDWRKKYA